MEEGFEEERTTSVSQTTQHKPYKVIVAGTLLRRKVAMKASARLVYFKAKELEEDMHSVRRTKPSRYEEHAPGTQYAKDGREAPRCRCRRHAIRGQRDGKRPLDPSHDVQAGSDGVVRVRILRGCDNQRSQGSERADCTYMFNSPWSVHSEVSVCLRCHVSAMGFTNSCSCTRCIMRSCTTHAQESIPKQLPQASLAYTLKLYAWCRRPSVCRSTTTAESTRKIASTVPRSELSGGSIFLSMRVTSTAHATTAVLHMDDMHVAPAQP
jgi:hypothetical protein